MTDHATQQAYPDHLTTERAWSMIEELGEWAGHLAEEAEPGSDDLYTAQALTKAVGAIQRLTDERDALTAITQKYNGQGLPAYLRWRAHPT